MIFNDACNEIHTSVKSKIYRVCLRSLYSYFIPIAL